MKLLNQTRDFASCAVNLAKLSHIFMTIWRPLMTAPPGVAGAAGASLGRCPFAMNKARGLSRINEGRDGDIHKRVWSSETP